MNGFTPDEVKILLTTLECHQANIEEMALANYNLIQNIKESKDDTPEASPEKTSNPRLLKELRQIQYLCRIHNFVFAQKKINELIIALRED